MGSLRVSGSGFRVYRPMAWDLRVEGLGVTASCRWWQRFDCHEGFRV